VSKNPTPAATRAARDLATLRESIAAMQAERDALASAGPSRAETVAAVDAWAAQAAAQAASKLNYAVKSSDITAALEVRARPDGVVQLGPLLAALMGPEVLAAALRRFIDDIPQGLPLADRRARIAELDAQILEAEMSEERAVEALEALGETVLRRADADPRAILWVPAS